MVIPAYNEERNIIGAIETVQAALQGQFSAYEILVINDASTDQTKSLILNAAKKDPNIKLIDNVKNLGMGGSLQLGLKKGSNEYVGSFPGDNAVDGPALSEMFKRVGEADIVSYYISNPEFRDMSRRFMSALFVNLVNTFFGLKQKYFNGHAIYRKSLLDRFTSTSVGHAFLPQLLIRMLKTGASCIEVPAIQYERKPGQTTAFSTRNVRSVFSTMVKLFWNIQILRRSPEGTL